MNERRSTVLSRLGGLAPSGWRLGLAIVLALTVSAVVILVAGGSPIEAYAALLKGSIGSALAFSNTGVRATPLILTACAVGLGVKGGLWNIGGEGQMYLGGLAATVVALIPLPVPAWLHLLLALAAGFAGGALWILVPAYLRAYRGVSELVTTLMLNWVAGYLISWLLAEPSPLATKGSHFPMSPRVLLSAHLPIILKGTSLHAGIILAVVVGAILHYVLRYTSFGFRTRLVGGNPETARYAGTAVARQIMLVLLIGGGIGGLAGASEILGLKFRLFDFFASGLGFDGLALAILANGSPLGIIAWGFAFGSLKAGASTMQIATGIDASMAQIIEALLVVFVIAVGIGERLHLNRRQQKE